MPRREIVLQVFVAAPSDVDPEREALSSVVHELNATWSRNTGIRFELLDWKNGVTPGIGSDSQAVINQQVGGSYDVFIAVVWSRIGTPTPRAASGTVEEIERAIARHRAGED